MNIYARVPVNQYENENRFHAEQWWWRFKIPDTNKNKHWIYCMYLFFKDLFLSAHLSLLYFLSSAFSLLFILRCLPLTRLKPVHLHSMPNTTLYLTLCCKSYHVLFIITYFFCSSNLPNLIQISTLISVRPCKLKVILLSKSR